jgi:UDP-N-acetylmuramoyl-tripeptide--D-alanyl-D-alanine ligase
MITPEALYEIFRKHPSITTDSRNIQKGDLFFALHGPNFNANEFAADALKKGAAYAVVDDVRYQTDSRILLCKDSLKTLQQLALYHRKQLRIPFIGITGSNGKTTTKELMHAVLSKKFKTIATVGNLNNHIGVPLTVLSVTAAHEIAVIEMGANHIGEIKNLCAICLPDYGLITSLGKAHLEGFGSFEGVIKAKTELYDHIRKNKGKLIVSSENDLLMGLSAGAERITYGSKNTDLVSGSVSGMDPCLVVSWKKNPGVKKRELRSHLIGQYNFENILAALCTGLHFGVDEQSVNDAIEAYIPSNNRSQLTQTAHNSLILDAYNANPASLSAAIENFSLLPEKNKVAIVGDMLELGIDSTEEHRTIARLIESKKFQKVILIGNEFNRIKGEFNADHFPNAEEALGWLLANPIEDAIILVKGSRGIKLEKLLGAL